jgi:hypothetical protein
MMDETFEKKKKIDAEMSRSPAKKSLLVKTQSDDDSYAYSEDDFEQLGSQDGLSSKLSPMKVIRKSAEFSAQSLMQNSSEAMKDEDDDEMSGDLEKYIMEMKINPSGLSKQLLSLDGMKSSQSVQSLQSKDRISSKIEAFPRKSGESSDVMRDSNLRSCTSEQQLSSQLDRPSNDKNQCNAIQKDEEVNEAQRVESLLMELFPEKYGSSAGKAKNKKKATSLPNKEALLAHPNVFLFFLPVFLLFS